MKIVAILADGQKVTLRNVVKFIAKETDEKSTRGKLNLEIASRIREQFARGNVDRKRLAEEYGVSLSAIQHVLNGETWVRP